MSLVIEIPENVDSYIEIYARECPSYIINIC